jgi:hypothetical protein
LVSFPYMGSSLFLNRISTLKNPRTAAPQCSQHCKIFISCSFRR